MKKTQYILLSLIIVFPFTVSAATFTLSPNSGNFQEGNTFTSIVSVNPAAGETITAAQLSIDFPVSNLELVSFTPVTGLLAPVAPAIDNVAGTLSYTAAFLPGITTATTFGTITFRAKTDGQAQVSFGSDTKLLDPTNADKQVASTGANYTVLVQAPAPTPSVTPPPAPSTTTITPTPTASVIETAVPTGNEPEEDGVATTTDEENSTTTVTNAQLAAAAAGVDTGSQNSKPWYYILAVIVLLLILAAAWRRWGHKIRKS
ncbi:MAG: hypothetical protein JKX80_02255 [Candidatus Pacebacteria bacterium]|nr:hypothetical protein [Candidatus Paceibacterota bacterium]